MGPPTHRDVVQSVKVWQRLEVRFVFDQFLCPTVEKAYVL
jgi:hypothetical protein